MQADLLLVENKRLQRCVSDLVSITALPAMWVGREPSEIASGLLDSILGMLDLDFAHLRLNNANGSSPLEATRLSQWAKSAVSPEALGLLLAPWISAESQEWPRRLVVSDSDLAVLPVRLGLLGEIGLLVVGSRRADFPLQTEGLVLNVAANQATIGLQAAWQLSERNRLAQELDQRVEARTRELAEANEDLRVSERKLRQLTETIPQMLWSATPDGSIDYCNVRLLDYTGLSADEAMGTGWTKMLHPDDVEPTKRVWLACIETGAPYQVEVRTIHAADGTYRWVLTDALPLRDDHGRIVRWYGSCIDIHDRKEAEDAIAASERKLAQIIDTIPVHVWSARSDGGIDFLNRHYLDYLGIRREQVQDWSLATAVHPDDLVAHVSTWNELLASGRGGESQARLRRFDGQYRWFLNRANPLKDSAGNIKWFGVTIDIDELKHAEENLRASEWDLRRLTEAIPQMLWSATPDGAIDYCNARLLDFTGFTVGDVMGNGWKRVVHPDDLDQAARAWATSVATGTPYQVEARLVHAADHSYRWCLTTGLPLRDEEGRILKWHGACVDMHNWKEAQDELRETQAKLAHMSRVMTMGQLTASIAHEVNQPLAGIVTNASTCLRMLGADPPNIEGARETARRTIRDGNRAAQVIARLRALFAKKSVTAETVDLNEATREVLALMSMDLLRNRVIVRVEIGDDPSPLVTGDRVQLQQVIMNLVRNASDAMTNVNDRARDLFIRVHGADQPSITFAVRDVGVGFDAEDAERLFDAFYTTKNNGMGIGLSVSRSIIESHGGRLWAEPNDGPGATFSFSIPTYARDATSDRTIEAFDRTSMRGEHDVTRGA